VEEIIFGEGTPIEEEDEVVSVLKEHNGQYEIKIDLLESVGGAQLGKVLGGGKLPKSIFLKWAL